MCGARRKTRTPILNKSITHHLHAFFTQVCDPRPFHQNVFLYRFRNPLKIQGLFAILQAVFQALDVGTVQGTARPH
jgi:hypothetical protein